MMLPPRTALLALLFVSVIAGVVRIAAAQTDHKPAQKFDEFGDIKYSDLMARLDNFTIHLMNEPHAKGFIVVYRTRRDLPGLNHSLAMRIKDYLVDRRGLPRSRVVYVDGGVAQNLTQQLWVVPSGAAPTPRADAEIGYIEDPDSAWKFNEVAFLPLRAISTVRGFAQP